MINNYVKMICGMLELPMPQVFYNDSALEPGQHARLTPDGKQLYLRKLKTASLDQLFAASSELRREWQRRRDAAMYYGSYKTREELPLREFSLQPPRWTRTRSPPLWFRLFSAWSRCSMNTRA